MESEIAARPGQHCSRDCHETRESIGTYVAAEPVETEQHSTALRHAIMTIEKSCTEVVAYSGTGRERTCSISSRRSLWRQSAL